MYISQVISRTTREIENFRDIRNSSCYVCDYLSKRFKPRPSDTLSLLRQVLLPRLELKFNGVIACTCLL